MDGVIVELKGKTFENNMIFGVIRGDAGKEDGTIGCIIDIVWGWIMEQKWHGNISFNREVGLNIEAIH